VVGVVGDANFVLATSRNVDDFYAPGSATRSLPPPLEPPAGSNPAGMPSAFVPLWPPYEILAVRSAITEIESTARPAARAAHDAVDCRGRSAAPFHQYRPINTDHYRFRLCLRCSCDYGDLTAVVAFSSVSLLTQEIAIRMALGASAPAIAGSYWPRARGLRFLDAALGVLGSLAVSPLFVPVPSLFGSSRHDPSSMPSVFLIMLLMALLASALPQRSAASADQIDALRSISEGGLRRFQRCALIPSYACDEQRVCVIDGLRSSKLPQKSQAQAD